MSRAIISHVRWRWGYLWSDLFKTVGGAGRWFKESGVDVIQVVDVEYFPLGICAVFCESSVH